MPLELAEIGENYGYGPFKVGRQYGRSEFLRGTHPMKLLEALEVVKQPVVEAAPTRGISLLCGFTPLHFKTFLAAHLRTNLPTSRIEIKEGLFGDLAGNVERLQAAGGGEACVVVEWGDLDQRLGIRSLGTWRAADIPDIVESARRQSARLTRLVGQLAESGPVYVSTPTLPLPPIFTTPGGRAHHAECELREIAASLATSVAACARTRVVASQRLDEVSPFGQRFDPKAEISTGFPYSLEHASRLAELIADLIRDAAPKKGLITDLDDTLWAGILGEAGVEGIAWDVSHGAHVHGLYQRFLDSLASAGVLLAAASKNDPVLVEQALARRDILLPRSKLFPLEINWGSKSRSVYRILEQWNIASDDVVFIDDSPMEVAEVQSVFPRMECLLFLRSDVLAVWNLLKQLRDRFGKCEVSSEDQVRLQSIRTASAFRETLRPDGTGTEDFLRNAEATISFSWENGGRDSRALELINKTNQFNLNGKRFSESEWLNLLRGPDAFLLTASYEDKYGSLGKIVVLMGTTVGSNVCVHSWVMSCRAFSRRIEHQCLSYLFEKTGVTEITFAFAATPRNGPIRSFFSELLGRTPAANLSLPKATFEARVPDLFHRVVELKSV
jgi:FkbH-like protein